MDQFIWFLNNYCLHQIIIGFENIFHLKHNGLVYYVVKPCGSQKSSISEPISVFNNLKQREIRSRVHTIIVLSQVNAINRFIPI